MAQNRKNHSAAVRFGSALKALLLCLFIGGSGVGYVWQQNQLLELGRQKVEKEKRRDAFRAQNDLLARQLSGLQSPKAIEARLKELNLGLTMASPTQVIHLLDEPLAPPARPAPTVNRTERQYAQRHAGSPLTP
jgi:uncharacterized protein HemX